MKIKKDYYKGFIFDLDGTLSYTLDSIAISGNLALKELGMKECEVDAYRYYCGDGANELVRRILRDQGDIELTHFDDLKSLYLKYFGEYADYKVRPYDEMPETVGKLRERGFKLAVLSNKPHAQCIEVVNKLYGQGAFDYIQGNMEGIKRKPSPEGAFLVADKLGIKADDFVYVGDTATDMNTGNAAGMWTVGALWGYRDEAELKGAEADCIINRPSELLSVISN